MNLWIIISLNNLKPFHKLATYWLIVRTYVQNILVLNQENWSAAVVG